MPRILSINTGAFSFSSGVLSLEKENLQEYYEVSSNTNVIDEGETVAFDFVYRNINSSKTIYWEILPSANVTYEDFTTLMNGAFEIANSGVETVNITAVKDFTNIGEESLENFNIRFRETNDSGTIITTSNQIDILDTSFLDVGQQAYTTPGSYTFTVPPRVNKISFVLIGGGGGHNWEIDDAKSGPGGGGLIYCNNLYVEEGQQIQIVVGDSGISSNTPTSGGNTSLTVYSGTESEQTIIAYGGGASVDYFTPGSGGSSYADALFSSNGASYVGRTGGSGGFARLSPSRNGGAGSAAGYSADGVAGGTGGEDGTDGQGGSGGSGSGFYDGTGGGTGIWGEGTNGFRGIFQSTYNYSILAGKAGSKLDSTEVYVQFGGGGASRLNYDYNLGQVKNAGTGAVRIMWPGQLRSYPSTKTLDESLETWDQGSLFIFQPVTDVTTVNEGGSITVNVNTFEYEDQTLYWTIEGVSGTINESDFSALSGSFVIQANNFGHFTVTTTEDNTTEGAETFRIQIRTGSTSGDVETETTVLEITDTSLNERGWFVGGFSTVTNETRIDRVTFASDTGTASIRGNSIYGGGRGAGVGNLSYGWHTYAGLQTSRITYSNDTVTSTSRGNLSLAREYHGGTTTNSFGWFGGGSVSINYSTRVDRLNFASDTSTASVRGPLSLDRHALGATGNDSYGWFKGGRRRTSPGAIRNTTLIDRITYSSDTNTASFRAYDGYLARYGLSATGNDSYGWFGGGSIYPAASPGTTSSVYRITYSNDTVNSSFRCLLSGVKQDLSATGNDFFGWFGGGALPAKISRVDRINYASDTSAVSIRGPLSRARSRATSSSGQG